MKHRQPKFWNLTTQPGGEAAELRIYGDIADNESQWFYDWFGLESTSPGGVRAQLKELGNAPLTVWIDSPGGNVDAGAAIYTALMEYPGRATAKIEARAYSAASVIAMACDTVLMSPMATMMVHLPWTEAVGNEHDLRSVADMLAECRETLINAYEIKTGRPRKELLELLEANNKQGTWMSAKKAVELGFANGLLYDWDSEPAQSAMVNHARLIYNCTRAAPPQAPTEDWAQRAAQRLAIENARK